MSGRAKQMTILVVLAMVLLVTYVFMMIGASELFAFPQPDQIAEPERNPTKFLVFGCCFIAALGVFLHQLGRYHDK